MRFRIVGCLLAVTIALSGGDAQARSAPTAPAEREEGAGAHVHGPGPGHAPHGHTAINYWQCGDSARNPPLGWMLINFTVLLLLLVKFVRQPLNTFLRERHQRVAADVAEASRLREQAQRELDEVQGKIEQLAAEIASIKEAARQQAAEEKKRMLLEAEDQADQIIVSAKRAVRQEIESAKRRLEAAALRAGMEAARQILQRSIEDQDHVRLHEEYVAQIHQAGGLK